MAGYPPPYGIPAVHYVSQPYYIGSYMQPTVSAVPQATVQQPWTEHTSHDGRKYYFNTVTKVTTWEKPEELKSSVEKLLANCPWKEFRNDAGKAYYYNANTKESVWTKPKELADAEHQAALTKPTSVPALTSIAATGTPITPSTPLDDQKPSEPSALEQAMKATLESFENETTAKVEPSHTPQMAYAISAPIIAPPAVTAPVVPEYKTRGEMAEGLRRLFREKKVPGNATWEQALKLIGDDPRYAVLKNFIEKKQIFNVYKSQRQKEEREEQRTLAKQAKENLEKFLLQAKEIHSTMSYRKVDQVLGDVSEWACVPEHDRRSLLSEAMQEIAKREKEESKALRKRNVKVFNEILNSMPKLTYRTTWSEAQHMLLDEPRFTDDKDLQSLDKEDALVRFEEHIRMLEREHDEEREREKRKQKRTQRKNREAFMVLLTELHENQILSSISPWKDLFQIIKKDDRFHGMLAQRGSTPLDLFKFFTENLKSRFSLDKKLIKEILRDSNTAVELSSRFEDFKQMVVADQRGKTIDLGNIRLVFDSLMEKAQGRERERQREEARRMRKFELAFCEMLREAVDPPIRTDTTWEEVSERFSDNTTFNAIPLESERMRVFKEYIIDLDSHEVITGNYEAKSSKSKSKSRKTRSRSRESVSYLEDDKTEQPSSKSRSSRRSSHRHRKRTRADEGDNAELEEESAVAVSDPKGDGTEEKDAGADEDDDEGKRKKHKKSKKTKSSRKRHRSSRRSHHRHHRHRQRSSSSESGSSAGEDEDDGGSAPRQSPTMCKPDVEADDGQQETRSSRKKRREATREDGEAETSSSESECAPTRGTSNRRQRSTSDGPRSHHRP